MLAGSIKIHSYSLTHQSLLVLARRQANRQLYNIVYFICGNSLLYRGTNLMLYFFNKFSACRYGSCFTASRIWYTKIFQIRICLIFLIRKRRVWNSYFWYLCSCGNDDSMLWTYSDKRSIFRSGFYDILQFDFWNKHIMRRLDSRGATCFSAIEVICGMNVRLALNENVIQWIQ